MGAFVDFETHNAMRESLDTERITFTMFHLWLGKIERCITVKLSGNFWSNGYQIT